MASLIAAMSTAGYRLDDLGLQFFPPLGHEKMQCKIFTNGEYGLSLNALAVVAPWSRSAPNCITGRIGGLPFAIWDGCENKRPESTGLDVYPPLIIPCRLADLSWPWPT